MGWQNWLSLHGRHCSPESSRLFTGHGKSNCQLHLNPPVVHVAPFSIISFLALLLASLFHWPFAELSHSALHWHFTTFYSLPCASVCSSDSVCHFCTLVSAGVAVSATVHARTPNIPFTQATAFGNFFSGNHSYCSLTHAADN